MADQQADEVLFNQDDLKTLFQPIDEVEDMEEYEILEAYPKQNSVKVKDKKTEKVLIIGPERADFTKLFD